MPSSLALASTMHSSMQSVRAARGVHRGVHREVHCGASRGWTTSNQTTNTRTNTRRTNTTRYAAAVRNRGNRGEKNKHKVYHQRCTCLPPREVELGEAEHQSTSTTTTTTTTTATPTSARVLASVASHGGMESVLVPRKKRGATTRRKGKKPRGTDTADSLSDVQQKSVKGFKGIREVGWGAPGPLGPSWVEKRGGEENGDDSKAEVATVNLAVFADTAEKVSLCLFDTESLSKGAGPVCEVPLCMVGNKTGHVWHVSLQVEKKRAKDVFYGYRINSFLSGPGIETSEQDVLVDPYAVAIASRPRWGQLARENASGLTERFGQCWAQHAGALPCLEGFDWEGDKPLGLDMDDLVIYELHVRGFTAHKSSKVESPGTYKGLTEKLDYLADLGINAIELMPVNEFNELEYYQLKPANGVYRYNVWGYSTVGFFAPMSRYASCLEEGGLEKTQEVVNEFKQMVKECHRRGIEVILDVVFNHTAEGNENGPCLSFRGFSNRVYYMLAPQGEYYNYSGCGNTFNCNHPVTREFILDCLRYWVVEMHVDGFRFDLASILSRSHSSWMQEDQKANASPRSVVGGPCPDPLNDLAAAVGEEEPLLDPYVHDAEMPTGTPLSDPPLLQAISTDPLLKGTKLIAEAWDCDGLNQVGSFPHYGGRWSEWNGIFRDNVRQFIKGSDGPWAGTFAGAICGCPDVYGKEEAAEGDWWGNNGGRRWRGTRGPTASVNFVTAHDGFTLADLVSYNSKHNEANGEQNKDGEQHNNSWNCGHEGKSKDHKVIRLRHKQIRNFATALLVSQGVPMLVMGDEYGHSKGGNNNTYCHDGDINYFQWDVCEKQKGLYRFFKKMIHLRKSNPNLRQSCYLDGSKICWHGLKASEPDWSDTSRLVAFSISGDKDSTDLYVAFNSGHAHATVEVPELQSGFWDIVVDTSKPAPFDFLESDEMLSRTQLELAKSQCQCYLDDGFYPLAPYSAIILKRAKKGSPSMALEDFSVSSTTISSPARKHSLRARKASPKPKAASSTKGARKKAAGSLDSVRKDILEENRKLREILEKQRQK